MAMLDKMKDSINAAGQGISTKIKDGLESERISAKIRDDEKMIEKLIYQVGVQCVKRHAEEAGTEYEELFAEIRRLRAQIEKEKEDKFQILCNMWLFIDGISESGSLKYKRKILYKLRLQK